MPNYHYTTQSPVHSFGHPWTPAVKQLIMINVILFILSSVFSKNTFLPLLSIQTPEFFSHLRLWQPITYLFIHSGFWHLAFNMLALWMFGCDVEKALGTKRFYQYYFITGIGAGICVALAGRLFGEHSMTVGASGAIFGILLAFGILFAERSITLLLFFVLPVTMKAKMMVFIFGIIEFVAGVGNAFGRVSHLAHLSGLFIGYLFFKLAWPDLTHRLDIFKNFRVWWLSKRTRPIQNHVDHELQVDMILDKISKKGMQSLSQKERTILSEASKRRHHRPKNN